MVTEQNDKLNRMVKTLLDMSELQTVGRDDKIILDAIVEEVLADLEPLAVEKNIKLIGKCEDATMIGSDTVSYTHLDYRYHSCRVSSMCQILSYSDINFNVIHIL